MRRMGHKKKYGVLAAFFALCLCAVCGRAYAAGKLTATLKTDEGPLADTEVRFYYLGEDAYVKKFQNAGVSFGFDVKDAATQAQHLWLYASAQNLKADLAGKTDAAGVAEFALPGKGYYLYGADRVSRYGEEFQPVPAICYLGAEDTKIEIKSVLRVPDVVVVPESGGNKPSSGSSGGSSGGGSSNSQNNAEAVETPKTPLAQMEEAAKWLALQARQTWDEGPLKWWAGFAALCIMAGTASMVHRKMRTKRSKEDAEK